MGQPQHTTDDLKTLKMAQEFEQDEELVMMQELINIAALVEHDQDNAVLQAWQQMALVQIVLQSRIALQQPSFCQLQLLQLEKLKHDMLVKCNHLQENRTWKSLL